MSTHVDDELKEAEGQGKGGQHSKNASVVVQNADSPIRVLVSSLKREKEHLSVEWRT